MFTSTPSLVGRGSVSTNSIPNAIAARVALTVFSGATTPRSPPAPRCPAIMFVLQVTSVTHAAGTGLDRSGLAGAVQSKSAGSSTGAFPPPPPEPLELDVPDDASVLVSPQPVRSTSEKR